MAGDELPDWQQEALDKLHRRLLEWLPDHKLHLVLIRAPFADEHGVEITDPFFERLLSSDPEAAQRQLIAEFEADRLAGLERDKQRAAEHRAGAQALRTFVATRRRNRSCRKAPPHRPVQQSIPLPW
jgi:hypothetical protein